MEPVDPVSGNVIPPGGAAEEVRDDVDIKASAGEYILPADVVKYFGLDYVEKLIAKAKAGMEELQANGRIGGETGEELPFTPEELVAHEQELAAETAPASEAPQEVPQMAMGGYIEPRGLTSPVASVKPTTAPATPIPSWMQDEPQEVHEGQGPRKEPTGFGRQIKEWSPQDYSDYADSKTNPVRGIADKVFSTVSPLAGMALKGLGKMTDRNALTRADDMLKANTDQLGNPLSKEDRAILEGARSRIAEQQAPANGLGGGLGGLLGNALGGLLGKKDEDKSKASSEKDKSSQRDSTSKNEKDKEKSSYRKGGLVTRRK